MAAGTEDTERHVRPALRALQLDQAALLDPDDGTGDDYVEYGLRGGFPSRRHAIEWYQRAIVRTLGHITDEWDPISLARDRTLVAALTGGRVSGLTDVSARAYRRVLISRRVLPACNRGYRDLRGGAGEYITAGEDSGPSWEDINPERQQHIGMRPGFQELDRKQRGVLNRLWGGFGDTTALEDWLHSLNEPTNGEISTVLPGKITSDRVAVRMLVDESDADESRARQYRETVAIARLLPAFADGVQSIDAGELAKQVRDNDRYIPSA